MLVIDDDAEQRTILRALLGALGFLVEAAATGEEGIAAAARIAPDIVLLDIQMPGIGGWEVAARLRAAQGAGMRIVMVSADAHAFRAGGDGHSSHDAFVTKPVELDALVALIGAQLNLSWEAAEDAAACDAPSLPAAERDRTLPPEAGPWLRQVREHTKLGHVRGIETALADFADAVPAAGPLVATLQRQLHDFDLRSLLKTIDDAAR